MKDGRFWHSEYAGEDLTEYYDAETLQSLIGEGTYSFSLENCGGIYYLPEF